MNFGHRKRKEDIGVSPFEIKSRVVTKASETKKTAICISKDSFTENEISTVEEIVALFNSGSLNWIQVVGLGNEEMMSRLSDSLNIPANIISDVMDPSLRSQVEDFDNGLFVTIKIVKYREETNSLISQNASLIITNNTVISFLEHHDDILEPIKNRVRMHHSRFYNLGADYLLFSLLDVIIDNYIYMLESYGTKIEALEEEIILKTDKSTLLKINNLKRELNRMRRDIRPAREMIAALSKLDTDFITETNETHYKELLDNVTQASELLDYFREVLYDSLDVYHSSMSTRLNDIMAVLTVFSVIFIPLSFIAGLYGMNFINMPELKYKNSYFIVLGVMAIIVVIMIFYFRRKKWF